MKKSEFVYVTYINSTPEKVWRALTEPEFTRQYFFGTRQECEWKVGAAWSLIKPDGTIADAGSVLEIDPPRRLVLAWKSALRAELAAEGFSRMTYEIAIDDGLVKLTVHHEMDVPESKLIAAVSNGWPIILSSLKSLLETGSALPGTNE